MPPISVSQATAKAPVERGGSEQAFPSPALLFSTLTAYQGFAALRAALDLDLFTAIADGLATVDAIAERCQSSTRGVRVLCDFLTLNGFLTKQESRYALTHDSFVFLNRRSPAYAGSAADFLLSSYVLDGFKDLTATVRAGTRDDRTLEPDNPIWVTFARAMAPLAGMNAALLADLLDVRNAGPMRVLDVAAGHGLYGVTIARRNQQAQIVAVDWAPVLEVAKENARACAIADRYQTIAGDAMKLDLGNDYDLVLLPNFLHHFPADTCTAFLGKLHTVLRPGGRIAALEFVPDENRVTPPMAASFSLTMLAMTPAGDAYTFGELERMFRDAGFSRIELHELPPAVQRVVTAAK